MFSQCLLTSFSCSMVKELDNISRHFSSTPSCPQRKGAERIFNAKNIGVAIIYIPDPGKFKGKTCFVKLKKEMLEPMNCTQWISHTLIKGSDVSPEVLLSQFVFSFVTSKGAVHVHHEVLQLGNWNCVLIRDIMEVDFTLWPVGIVSACTQWCWPTKYIPKENVRI